MLDNYRSVMTTNVFNIPERLKEYDESFFIARNHKTHKFEVHSTDNKFNTLCFVVPFDELDQRTIDIVMKNDTKKRSVYQIVDEMDRQNAKLEAKRELDMKNMRIDLAKETYSAFKKDISNEYIGV